MFLPFLLYLRQGGMKISMKDWLSLIEALQMGLHGQSLRGFFVMSRALLVKTEADLDKYEELFYKYFGGISSESLEKELASLSDDMQRAGRIFADYIEKKDMDLNVLRSFMESRLAAVEAGDGEDAGIRLGDPCPRRQEIQGLEDRLHHRIETVPDGLQTAA